jgi:ABC-type phosphate/phosphonate transport system substrate-binding protein
MRPITLLVPTSLGLTEDVLLELRGSVLTRCGLSLAPVRLASGALLPEILERVPDAVAWASSSVAFALGRMQLATPLLAAPRGIDERPRSSVLVAHPNVESLVDLAGRRAGWVSRLSATGYHLPRLYLESFGVDTEALFRMQRFCGTHEAAIDALALGQVDVIATDSRRLEAVLARTPARVLASVGPVPSDLLVAGSAVPSTLREQLARGLESLGAGDASFERVRHGHLDLFEMLGRHASVYRPRPRDVTDGHGEMPPMPWS